MKSRPERLRRWATLLRGAGQTDPRIAHMLEGSADEIEQLRCRVERLEDENARLLRDLDMLAVGPWDERAL